MAEKEERKRKEEERKEEETRIGSPTKTRRLDDRDLRQWGYCETVVKVQGKGDVMNLGKWFLGLRYFRLWFLGLCRLLWAIWTASEL